MFGGDIKTEECRVLLNRQVKGSGGLFGKIGLVQMSDAEDHDAIPGDHIESSMSRSPSNAVIELTHFVREEIALRRQSVAMRILLQFKQSGDQACVPTICLINRTIVRLPIILLIEFLLRLCGENDFVHHASEGMFLRRRKSASNSRSGETRPASISSMPC